MKIYLDIFFLVNTGMNFVVLMLESFFQNRRIHPVRLLLTAALGGILSVIFLVSGVHRFLLLSLLLYIMGSVVIVRAAFGKTTVGALIRNLIMFYLSSFILSGLLTYMQNTLGLQGGLIFLLAGAGSVLWLAYRLSPVGRKWWVRQRQYVPFCLSYGGRQVRGNGLMDTGNHLTEPFSRQPVIIGGRDFLTPLFSQEEPVFRYIPYHSIGTESGMIPAFQAECLELEENGRWQRLEKPWIAIYDSYVSADGEYELILHPDMIMNL